MSDSDEDLFGDGNSESQEDESVITEELFIEEEPNKVEKKKTRKKTLNAAKKKLRSDRKKFQNEKSKKRQMIAETRSGPRKTKRARSVQPVKNEKREKQLEARRVEKRTDNHPYNTTGFQDTSKLFIRRKKRLDKLNEEIRKDGEKANLLVQEFHETHTKYISFNEDKPVPDFYTENTSLCCYWCTEPCNCVPIPISIGYNRYCESFRVFGHCCSVECGLAYIRANSMSEPIYRHMLRILYEIPSYQYIRESPPRYILKKFGGVYEINQYRQTNKLEIKYEKVCMPLVPFFHGLVEREKVVNKTYRWGTEEESAQLIAKSVIDATSYRNSQRWETREGCDTRKRIPRGGKTDCKKNKRKERPKPTVEEQISWTHTRMTKQMKDNGIEDNKNKKTLTMMDFVKIKSSES